MKNYAFNKGWRKANEDQKKALMKGLMKIYDVTSVQAVYARIRGDVEPKISQAKATEKLFARSGITEIWGAKKKSTVKS
jgi:hypothetical protein